MGKKQKRFRLSDEVAEYLGCELNSSKRYRLKPEQIKNLVSLQNKTDANDVSNVSETLPNDYNKSFVLSAWNSDKNTMMDIDTYCSHYGLPREDVSSYKLISHTGTPYYNIVFKENSIAEEIDIEEAVKSAIRHSETLNIRVDVQDNTDEEYFTRLVYTDVHVGMDTNPENASMYSQKWDEEALMDTANVIIKHTVENKKGECLVIDDLGDLLDGFNGKTTRGGHDLPQNMSNQEAFSAALRFKLHILDNLVEHFDSVFCNNITNDNHSGDWGACLNKAFLEVVKVKHPRVLVKNIPEFIGHYYMGSHAFILSHGKDKRNLKFGFKPILDTKQIEHIDQYLKYHNVFSKAKYIEFSKGDSHLMLLDYSTSQDFDYFSYPALSPSSDWVQTNYKRGIRGFVVQQVSLDSNTKNIIPYIF